MRKEVKKVPVILQMEALECGAASLAMVLAYYKKYIPLEKLRIDCNISRDGSNAKYILMAARYHGLKAKGYRFSVDKLWKECSFPAIIHWNFNHFVVLDGFKKNKAIINDPASGMIEVDREVFCKSYTGVALLFEPERDFKPEGKPKSVLQFLIKRLRGSIVPLTFVLFLGFILSIVELVKPIFYKLFVDSILIGNHSDWMQPMLFSMFFALILGFFVGALKSIYLYRIKTKMSVQAASMFIWHVLRLPIEFFSQRFIGDISARQESNDTIADHLCNQLAPVLLNVVMIGLYFVIMVHYDIAMASIGILMIFINLILIKIVAKKNYNGNKNMQRDAGKLSGIMVSGISMIETIKASGAEFGFFEKIAGYQAKYSNSLLGVKRRNTYIQILPQLLAGVCNGGILIIGVYYILSGKFTVGTLMAFQGFMSLFLTPMSEVINSMQTIQDMSGSMERIEDVMNYKAEVELNFDEEEIVSYQKLTGEVELRNVSFGYSNLCAPLISNFNVTAKKGEMIAFVGGSGSGKSTLAKLISGLYPVRDGAILFDGKQKKEIDRYVFTNSVAVVDQNIVLFQDTIKNNITMWDETVIEEAIICACKDACIHDDIIARKEGYDFIVKEGGGNFSGGQRQRIEIARAFVANPSIIILDEATSALDPSTEKKIMNAIKRRGITCFIIAHRLSTIRDADEIILLEYGKEVERGTHKELMKNNGNYTLLVKSE